MGSYQSNYLVIDDMIGANELSTLNMLVLLRKPLKSGFALGARFPSAHGQLWICFASVLADPDQTSTNPFCNGYNA